MAFDRDDLKAGRISDLEIDNGIVVPASLRIGALTLSEHKEFLEFTRQSPLTIEEIARIYPNLIVDEE